MTVTQDGDEEGCLRLLALPTPEQAALIRDVLLLRKRRALTEASRAALISAGVKGRFQAQEAAMAPGLDPRPSQRLQAKKSPPSCRLTPWHHPNQRKRHDRPT